MTEQSLDKYDIRKRDEEANINRVHQIDAAEKQQCEKHSGTENIVTGNSTVDAPVLAANKTAPVSRASFEGQAHQ